jgi:hypothetical protein
MAVTAQTQTEPNRPPRRRTQSHHAMRLQRHRQASPGFRATHGPPLCSWQSDPAASRTTQRRQALGHLGAGSGEVTTGPKDGNDVPTTSKSAHSRAKAIDIATNDWNEWRVFPTVAITSQPQTRRDLPSESIVTDEETRDWLASQEFPVQPITQNRAAQIVVGRDYEEITGTKCKALFSLHELRDSSWHDSPCSRFECDVSRYHHELETHQSN